jgi:hypothetical protein
LSNKNTVVRAIRIDSSLDKSIAEVAEQKGLSFNLLVNQILAKFSEYDRVSEKLGLIDIPPSTIKNLLSLITNEESEKLGELSGFAGRNAKQFVTMLMGNSSLDSFISTLKLLEKYSGAFSTEISANEQGEAQIIMSHNLGVKWSHFLKGMMAATLREIYGLDAQFEVTETFVTTSFCIPKKIVTATSLS